MSKRHICNKLGTTIGSKLKLTGKVKGSVELNQKALCASRLSEGPIGNKQEKLSLFSQELQAMLMRMLNEVQRSYMHRGCQNGASATSQEQLRKLS